MTSFKNAAICEYPNSPGYAPEFIPSERTKASHTDERTVDATLFVCSRKPCKRLRESALEHECHSDYENTELTAAGMSAVSECPQQLGKEYVHEEKLFASVA